MATDTQAQQNALREQRTDDLQAARKSTNAAGKAHDLAQARALTSEIQTNARANNAAATAPTPATPTTAAAQPTDPTTGYPYGSSMDTQTIQQQDTVQGNNASAQIGSTLSSLGLGGMTSWATNLAYSLSGQGISASDIVNTITSQMNNPTNADGSVNQDALNAFNSALPGFNELIQKTGQNGSPGSSPAQAIANYINYGAQVKQFASQAGLLPDTITTQDIGNLWAGQVSSSEVSQRITDATVAATSAPKPVQDYLSNNFGMTPAALTSYYLNPTNTLQTIQTNMNTGMVGGEAAITGFDKNLSVAQSQALGAFLANGASGGSASGVGQVNNVTAGAANSFFQSGISGVQGTLAQTSTLENPTAGTLGGAVSADQIIAAGEGDIHAQQAVSQSQQQRTASSSGGGGAATTSQGSVGLGYANQ